MVEICGTATALEAPAKVSGQALSKVQPGIPGTPEYDYGVCMEFRHSDELCRYSEVPPEIAVDIVAAA